MTRRPTQLVVTLLAVTTAIVLVFGTVLLVHQYVTPIPRLKSVFNMNGEANVPTWWNSALLGTIGFAALVARAFESERLARRAWLVVAAAGMVLSLDEIASLHERLGEPVREIGIEVPTFAWLVPGVVIAAALFVVLVALGRGLPPRTRRWLFLALVCYLGGAVGVEAINGTQRGADRLISYWIGTTVEETVEMVACIIAIGAIAQVIADQWALRVAQPGLGDPIRLELVGNGLAGRGDRADPDPLAVRRVVERGRPEDQVRAGRRVYSVDDEVEKARSGTPWPADQDALGVEQGDDGPDRAGDGSRDLAGSAPVARRAALQDAVNLDHVDGRRART